jgi:hypothetical protein
MSIFEQKNFNLFVDDNMFILSFYNHVCKPVASQMAFIRGDVVQKCGGHNKIGLKEVKCTCVGLDWDNIFESITTQGAYDDSNRMLVRCSQESLGSYELFGKADDFVSDSYPNRMFFLKNIKMFRDAIYAHFSTVPKETTVPNPTVIPLEKPVSTPAADAIGDGEDVDDDSDDIKTDTINNVDDEAFKFIFKNLFGEDVLTNLQTFEREQPQRYGPTSLSYLKMLRKDKDLCPVIAAWLALSVSNKRKILQAILLDSFANVTADSVVVDGASDFESKEDVVLHELQAKRTFNQLQADTALARLKGVVGSNDECVTVYSLSRGDTTAVFKVDKGHSVLCPIIRGSFPVFNSWTTLMIGAFLAKHKSQNTRDMSIVYLKQYKQQLSSTNPAGYFVKTGYTGLGEFTFVVSGVTGKKDGRVNVADSALIPTNLPPHVTVSAILSQCPDKTWSDAVQQVFSNNPHRKVDVDVQWFNAVGTIEMGCCMELDVQPNYVPGDALAQLSVSSADIGRMLTFNQYFASHGPFFNIHCNLTSQFIQRISEHPPSKWHGVAIIGKGKSVKDQKLFTQYECRDTGNLIPSENVRSYRIRTGVKHEFQVVEYQKRLDADVSSYTIPIQGKCVYKEGTWQLWEYDANYTWTPSTLHFFDFVAPGNFYARLKNKTPTVKTNWIPFNCGTSHSYLKVISERMRDKDPKWRRAHFVTFVGKEDFVSFFTSAYPSTFRLMAPVNAALAGCFVMVLRGYGHKIIPLEQNLYNYENVVVSSYNLKQNMFTRWPPMPILWAKCISRYHKVDNVEFASDSVSGLPFDKREVADVESDVLLATITKDWKDKVKKFKDYVLDVPGYTRAKKTVVDDDQDDGPDDQDGDRDGDGPPSDDDDIDPKKRSPASDFVTLDGDSTTTTTTTTTTS